MFLEARKVGVPFGFSLSFEISTVTVGIDGGGIGFMFWGFSGAMLDCVVRIFYC